MGPRLGHLAVAVLLMLGGCSTAPGEPAAHPTRSSQPSVTVESSIPEPSPSAAPYVDAPADLRPVVENFVHSVLEYDAAAETRTSFLSRASLITTPAELDRLRRSPRARLNWRALRDRNEAVSVIVTGVSVAAAGDILVAAERTTHTSFGTVRDLIHLNLRVGHRHGGLIVAHAGGGGL